MKTNSLEPDRARQAFRSLPDVAAQESLVPPDLRVVFVPQEHPKALSIDSSVVVGIRGAGKSFWTAVLNSEPHRRFVADLINQPSLATVTTGVGFGLDETNVEHPSSGAIRQILGKIREPIHLWQTVVLRHCLRAAAVQSPLPERWTDAVRWVAGNVSEADDLMTQCDARLSETHRMLLILFDAFDRLSTDWAIVRTLTTAALRLGLTCRSRRAIRLKLFLRPDLEEDKEIWRFPDSSKLQQAKVELNWRTVDLYGLLLRHLGNSESFGPLLREDTSRRWRFTWDKRGDVFVMQGRVADEPTIRKAIESLVDEYMGKSKKRGYTYTWIPTHLADAAGRISPRSYLLAFRKAAEVTAERYPEHDPALHYLAIQEGVVAASQTRVREVIEDYPWVEPLFEAARGLAVPTTPEELMQVWRPDCLSKVKSSARQKLPPRRYSTDPVRRDHREALIDDLVELAVLYRTEDGRLNMPDIFRVAFGIKRKGGVKPPR